MFLTVRVGKQQSRLLTVPVQTPSLEALKTKQDKVLSILP